MARDARHSTTKRTKRSTPRERRAHAKKAPAKRVTRSNAPPKVERAIENGLPPGVHLSVSQCAEEFGHDRRWISKKIAELGIRPVGERQGYPVYRLRDLLDIERRGADGNIDPNKLDPLERLNFYKAETERLKVAQTQGQLVQREDVLQTNARVLKLLVQNLETIVDRIERESGAPSYVLEKIEEVIHQQREMLYHEIVTLPPDEPQAEPSEGEQLDLVEVSDGANAIRASD